LATRSRIATNFGWTLINAEGINNSGQIVGTDPSGQTEAFLLTPTPEPSTVALPSPEQRVRFNVSKPTAARWNRL